MTTNSCIHEWEHKCKKCRFPSELDGITETERSSAIEAFQKISELTEHDSAIYQLAASEHAALVHFRGSQGPSALTRAVRHYISTWHGKPPVEASCDDPSVVAYEAMVKALEAEESAL